MCESEIEKFYWQTTEVRYLAGGITETIKLKRLILKISEKKLLAGEFIKSRDTRVCFMITLALYLNMRRSRNVCC